MSTKKMTKKEKDSRVVTNAPTKKIGMNARSVGINKQKVEKVDHNPRGLVDVISVYRTIQGEGPYSGLPALFVRLAGCTLQCPACDTDYTTNRRKVTPNRIVSECQMNGKKGELVVLTGGEPFRQNIRPLVKLLLNTGFKVQIETNGTVDIPDFPYSKVTVVCSPKSAKIHDHFLNYSNYFKYILDAKHIDKTDGLPTQSFGMKQRPARPGMSTIPIYVQPMDAKSEKATTANLEAAVQSCLIFNYRLCLQLPQDFRITVMQKFEDISDKALIGLLIHRITKTQTIGDPNLPLGMMATPERVVKSWEELFSGYSVTEDMIKKEMTIFDGVPCESIVLAKDIEFYSTCEHHMLPFFGRAHVAYIPGKTRNSLIAKANMKESDKYDYRVVGLSKLARVVEWKSRKFQMQERICEEVTECLEKYLQPEACACIIEATHFCMCARGIAKQHSSVIVHNMKGGFLDEMGGSRQESMAMIYGRR